MIPSAFAQSAIAANCAFYDALWSRAQLTRPEAFNTWPLVSSLASTRTRRLELGPGLHPRLPLTQSWFIDASEVAVGALRAEGALAHRGPLDALPFGDRSMDLVGAFDVIEHVDDDEAAVSEIARVLCTGGVCVLSVPLHPHRWSDFDTVVGHRRRYEPRAVVRLLARHGLAVERSAAFGMKPRDGLLTRVAVLQLQRHFERAMQWYNRVLLPIALHWQKPLEWSPGLDETTRADDMLLVCRRERAGLAS